MWLVIGVMWSGSFTVHLLLLGGILVAFRWDGHYGSEMGGMDPTCHHPTSPNFACKSQIAIREPQNGQKQPQNRTYEAISGSGGSKLVGQGGTRLVQGRKHP